MSRRLIIAILALLILGFIGGAIAFVITSLNPPSIEQPESPLVGELPTAEIGEIVSPEEDTDNDGLSNALEFLWQTDPNNADTDGDGVLDGEEVARNRNPTIAGPNDELPKNFEPKQDVALLPEAEPLNADPFFADNLELSGGGANYSEAYQGKFDANERNADTLAEYVQEQPIVQQIPRVNDDRITTDTNAGPRTLGQYLREADGRPILSDQDRLIAALGDLYGSNDPDGIRTYSLRVKLFEDELLQMTVPEAALDLHKVLLGYTALKSGSLTMIEGWRDDPVKAMVGLRQLENADRRFLPLLDREFARLAAQAIVP